MRLCSLEKLVVAVLTILANVAVATSELNSTKFKNIHGRVREKARNIVFTNELLRTAVDDFIRNPAHAILTYGPIQLWNTSHVTDMSHLFSTTRNSGAETFNENIGKWNVAKVTAMTRMFAGAKHFNRHLRAWHTVSVTTMNSMFLGAAKLNKPIGIWKVGRVKDMESMFRNAKKFDSNLKNWNVENVFSMRSMFEGAESFNKPIRRWVPQRVVDMSSMFRGAVMFQGELDTWPVKSVTDMSGMFANARRFNSTISGWEVGHVRDMSQMFQDASTFNTQLSGWDVSKCERMDAMFERARLYDRPMASWTVSRVRNMMNMFAGATRFNQQLDVWDVTQVIDASDMFASAKKFNRPLNSWVLASATDIDRMFAKATSFNQDLCSWGTRVSERISTIHVFAETDCPTEADPDLEAVYPGPFCHFCTPIAPTASPVSSGPPPQALFTADDTSYSSGVTYTDRFPGTTGDVSALLNGPGSTIEWLVTVRKAEQRRLVFRYGNGDANDNARPARLLVAGVVKGTVPFKSTGGFGVWSTDDNVVVFLKPGTYGIRLQSVGEGVNVDFMIVSH